MRPSHSISAGDASALPARPRRAAAGQPWPTADSRRAMSATQRRASGKRPTHQRQGAAAPRRPATTIAGMRLASTALPRHSGQNPGGTATIGTVTPVQPERKNTAPGVSGKLARWARSSRARFDLRLVLHGAKRGLEVRPLLIDARSIRRSPGDRRRRRYLQPSCTLRFHALRDFEDV